MLQISPKAAQEFKKVLLEKGKAGQAVRIFAMGSGCCGPSVGMDLVEKGQTGDETIEQDGLRVYVEPKASEALDGVTIDFSERGFTLQQPGGGSCCG